MSVAAVVIPYRYSRERQRVLRWCLRRYGVEIVHLPLGGDPWVKARAVTPAIEASDADIIVMADADVWCDGIDLAIEEVELGAPWAVPHWLVHRLSKEGTAKVLGGAEWRKQTLEEKPYQGVVGGGYVVARRDVLLDCPLDPRFVGWGQEDEAWGLALATLYGAPWRGDADLVHLWHPAPARLTRARGSKESWDLRRRYIDAHRHHQATGSKNQMLQLCLEATDALHSSEPAVPDRTSEPVG